MSDDEVLTLNTLNGYRDIMSELIQSHSGIGVIATVGCSASVVQLIADAFREDELRKYANVDGVVPVVHGLGWAQSKY